jgi:SAM-dependent methyltransferase
LRQIKLLENWRDALGINFHQDLINRNHEFWKQKPLLQRVYRDFYGLIAKQLSNLPDSKIVELGSGLGNIRDVIPDCIQTDLFQYPWIDQVENAYKLSFADDSISDLILTDVFHHLKYPGTALLELYRVLRKGGRVILFEPCISVLGFLVYGVFHQEPIAITQEIEWFATVGWSPEDIDYYAAQGNALRIFVGSSYASRLKAWQKVSTIRLSAVAYVASGGYSKPQLSPMLMLPLIYDLEKGLDLFPSLFANRLLAVLEK